MKFELALAICCVLHPIVAWSHGDLHEQITALTREIERSPHQAGLFLKRGELHRVHQEWSLALRDFDQAERLDPGLSAASFCRGRALYESGNWLEARRTLDNFLIQHSQHVEARVTRARTLAKLNEPIAAAADFTVAIALSGNSDPDLYFERARVLTLANGSLAEEALRGLDEGIAKCGPLITLELSAIDLELTLKRYDAALERIDRLASQSPRKEPWLLRRGEVLLLAGRATDARQHFERALAELEKLPVHLRRTKATTEMQAQLRQRLEKPSGSESVQASR